MAKILLGGWMIMLGWSYQKTSLKWGLLVSGGSCLVDEGLAADFAQHTWLELPKDLSQTGLGFDRGLLVANQVGMYPIPNPLGGQQDLPDSFGGAPCSTCLVVLILRYKG